ncbi:unnamed protein product [Calypogeia fissa]
MKGARTVAAAAALGNLLQGWDNAAVAGALLYLRVEFNLDENPTLEGLVVAATLIGAVASTAVSGPAADSLGRRFMLTVSGVLFAIAAVIMVWSPNIYVLIFGRFVVGAAIGLAATIVPILISESAPTEIRGQLATLPQLMGSTGLFLAYCFVFGLSLLANPSWRLILGVICIPAVVYLGLCLFYLPESPRWLVSKGRMLEARVVLQGLRGQEDVSGELALLVEGLGVGVETSMEEWLVRPAERSDILDPSSGEDGQITLFGPGGQDEDVTWLAEPIKDESGHGLLSRRASADIHFVDNVVSLFGSLQTADLDFGNFNHAEHGNDLNHEYDADVFQGDEEAGQDANGYSSDDTHEPGIVGDLDESHLDSPLLHKLSSKNNVFSRKNSSMSRGSSFIGLSRQSSFRTIDGMFGETVSSVGIGGGWQMAWRTDGENYERVYLRQEQPDTSRFTSHMSLPGVGGGGSTFGADGDAFQAVALIGPSVQFNKDIGLEDAVGPAVVHPSETATKGPAWSDLADIGVKRALIVGVGLQFLQQFCGINAVLYFTPQILKQSGADAMASSLGLTSDSVSILASAFTCFLMIPCIFVAMWLMDRAGRRQLLLTTLPVLGSALIVVIIVNTFFGVGIIQAVGSFVGLCVFICSFVMGFGPIPNILCSEIFPTRVRGLAIGITSATMWVCNVIVSYAFPVANAAFGLVGVFLFFAIMSVIAWVFVFLKVPETKGLPLEIICEFFAMTGNHHGDAHELRKPLLEDSHDPIKKV